MTDAPENLNPITAPATVYDKEGNEVKTTRMNAYDLINSGNYSWKPEVAPPAAAKPDEAPEPAAEEKSESAPVEEKSESAPAEETPTTVKRPRKSRST